MWTPIVNYAYLILALVASTKVQSASPSGQRAYTKDLQRKLDAAKQGSKSISKNVVINSLLLMQDFTEDRIAECKSGKAYSFESWNIHIVNGYLDAIVECAENYGDGSNDGSIVYEALESYIRCYT